jgi:endonuclease-3
MRESKRAEGIIEALKAYYAFEATQRGDESPFRVLIGCVLSQRTRDANSEKAAMALFWVANDPESVLNLGGERLRQLIRCSGYYNQKADRILRICSELLRRFDGEVPADREKLLSLPGVGPKTADMVLNYAFLKPTIAVDVHVRRTAIRLGLAEKSSGVEGVKKDLEHRIREDDRRFMDNALVQLGKDFCRPRSPRCSECPVENLCPSKREMNL